MFDATASKEKLAEITQLFGNVKSIIIYAEEIASDFDTYPQILLELRNTLDHLLRAVAAEINPTEFEAQYANQSLNKSYSHLYRAAYDALDWTAIAIRENIIEELKGFTPKSIDKAIPDYYPKIKPDIDEINSKISQIRNSKDIASSQKNLQAFGEYLGYIETLRNHHKTVMRAKSSLIEIEGDSKVASRRFWAGTILVAIVSILIGSAITYFLTKSP